MPTSGCPICVGASVGDSLASWVSRRTCACQVTHTPTAKITSEPMPTTSTDLLSTLSGSWTSFLAPWSLIVALVTSWDVVALRVVEVRVTDGNHRSTLHAPDHEGRRHTADAHEGRHVGPVEADAVAVQGRH